MWRYLRLILLRIYERCTTKNGTLGNGVTLPYSCIKQTVWDEIAFFSWIIPDPLCNSDHAIFYVPCGSASCNKCVCLCVSVCVCVCLCHKTTQIDQSVLMRSTDRMGTSQNDRCAVFWTTDASKYHILTSLTWAKRHNCLPHFTVRDHTGMCHQSFSLWSADFSKHILTVE
jgi:hypothetical protein